MTEPAVWHVVGALGSVGVSTGESGVKQPKQYALEHYSKGMKALRNKIMTPNERPHHLTLLVCLLSLLFVTFEFQQKGHAEARSRFTSGMSIFRGYGQDPSTSNDAMDPLVEAFERLGVEMASFTSGAVHFKESRTDGSETTTTELEDISKAILLLNYLMDNMRDLDHTLEKQRSKPGGLTRSACEGSDQYHLPANLAR